MTKRNNESSVRIPIKQKDIVDYIMILFLSGVLLAVIFSFILGVTKGVL